MYTEGQYLVPASLVTREVLEAFDSRAIRTQSRMTGLTGFVGQIALTWAVLNGELEVVGVELVTTGGDPIRPITPTMFRDIALGQIKRDHAAHPENRRVLDLLKEASEPVGTARKRRRAPSTSDGRVDHDEAHWRKVLRVARAAKAAGTSQRRAVCAAFPDCRSEATAAVWIRRARKYLDSNEEEE